MFTIRFVLRDGTPIYEYEHTPGNPLPQDQEKSILVIHGNMYVTIAKARFDFPENTLTILITPV